MKAKKEITVVGAGKAYYEAGKIYGEAGKAHNETRKACIV